MRLLGWAVNWYTTHRPSGENADRPKGEPGAAANTVAFVSRSEYVHTSLVLFFSSVNDKVCPSGDHESGMCAAPLSGLVRRSAVPSPSARCHQMARSPSRSDWNATRVLSEDHTG